MCCCHQASPECRTRTATWDSPQSPWTTGRRLRRCQRQRQPALPAAGAPQGAGYAPPSSWDGWAFRTSSGVGGLGLGRGVAWVLLRLAAVAGGPHKWLQASWKRAVLEASCSAGGRGGLVVRRGEGGALG